MEEHGGAGASSAAAETSRVPYQGPSGSAQEWADEDMELLRDSLLWDGEEDSGEDTGPTTCGQPTAGSTEHSQWLAVCAERDKKLKKADIQPTHIIDFEYRFDDGLSERAWVFKVGGWDRVDVRLIVHGHPLFLGRIL